MEYAAKTELTLLPNCRWQVSNGHRPFLDWSNHCRLQNGSPVWNGGAFRGSPIRELISNRPSIWVITTGALDGPMIQCWLRDDLILNRIAKSTIQQSIKADQMHKEIGWGKTRKRHDLHNKQAQAESTCCSDLAQVIGDFAENHQNNRTIASCSNLRGEEVSYHLRWKDAVRWLPFSREMRSSKADTPLIGHECVGLEFQFHSKVWVLPIKARSEATATAIDWRDRFQVMNGWMGLQRIDWFLFVVQWRSRRRAAANGTFEKTIVCISSLIHIYIFLGRSARFEPARA